MKSEFTPTTNLSILQSMVPFKDIIYGGRTVVETHTFSRYDPAYLVTPGRIQQVYIIGGRRTEEGFQYCCYLPSSPEAVPRWEEDLTIFQYKNSAVDYASKKKVPANHLPKSATTRVVTMQEQPSSPEKRSNEAHKRQFLEEGSLSKEEKGKKNPLAEGTAGVIKIFDVTINAQDIKDSLLTEWLNDSIIDGYFRLLIDKVGEKNAVFVRSLLGSVYVPDRNANAFNPWSVEQLKKTHWVLIPVHLQNHWALGVADVESRQIFTYDSLGSGDYSERLSDYCQNTMIIHSAIVGENAEPFYVRVEECLEQVNENDCGYHTLYNATQLIRKGKVDKDEEGFLQFKNEFKSGLTAGRISIFE